MDNAHPTQHTWAFWEHRTSEKKTMTKQEWANLQKKLFSFSTVEEFWNNYVHIPPPSDVFYDGKARKRVGVPPQDRFIESFSIFKEGIAPEWEDSANINGGEWNLRKSGRGNEGDMIDEWWQNLVLGLIGETIDTEDHICGARVVDKSGGKGSHPVYRIELWLRTKDVGITEGMKTRMIDIMTDSRAPRTLSDQFQWKMHGV
jgi:hypothetical protein|tara:strand:- start:3535 stop:4140 length:606 start_codon:yes stop_codon:yes gene_type:complete|mmetsp:Transcript_10910/g.35797  ORF Transcript_10910/g.35797 Transcript_10910/m.35797 type:complete len:202 (+) Transcript_10910:2-607(+)